MRPLLRRDALRLLVRLSPVAKLKPTVGGLEVQFICSGEVMHRRKFGEQSHGADSTTDWNDARRDYLTRQTPRLTRGSVLSDPLGVRRIHLKIR